MENIMVCGENLSLTSGNSLLWWLNGSNNPGAQPDKNFTDQSDKVFIWDLKTNSSVNRNFNYSESRVPISSHGSPFILAVGFTAQDANKPGVIKDFGYYAPFEVAAKHPSLMQRLGFTATSLTSAIKRKTLQLDSNRKEAVAEIASNDYAAAYQLYKEVRSVFKSEDEGTHTVSYEKSLNGIHARFDDQHIRIQFYNDSTVRVSKGFNMQFNDGESWAVTASPDAEIALSVVEHNGVVSMESSKMRVEYTLSNGRAELYRIRRRRADLRHGAAPGRTARPSRHGGEAGAEQPQHLHPLFPLLKELWFLLGQLLTYHFQRHRQPHPVPFYRQMH